MDEMKRLGYIMTVTTAALALTACGSSGSGVAPEAEPKLEAVIQVESPDEKDAQEKENGDTGAQDTVAGQSEKGEAEETAPGGEETDAESFDGGEEAGQEDETLSPMVLWEYTGYVDEAAGYYWKNEFKGCDYDGDEKTDRLYRSYKDGDYCTYNLEFGNGRSIEIPGAVFTGFPHITGADTDGDGEAEILFTLTYDTSTDPYSVGNIWLFDLQGDSYQEVELPFEKGDDHTSRLSFEMSKNEDDLVTISCPEIGFEGSQQLDQTFVENFWFEPQGGKVESTIFFAEVPEGEGTIRCYVEPIFKLCTLLGMDLVYESGEYVIKNPEYGVMPEREI